MTRNEAYKLARKFWRENLRRGKRLCDPDAWQNIAYIMSAAGYTTKDARIVKEWVKAFSAGRRWPEAAKIEAIERSS